MNNLTIRIFDKSSAEFAGMTYPVREDLLENLREFEKRATFNKFYIEIEGDYQTRLEPWEQDIINEVEKEYEII